jgi:hypothetical protein
MLTVTAGLIVTPATVVVGCWLTASFTALFGLTTKLFDAALVKVGDGSSAVNV